MPDYDTRNDLHRREDPTAKSPLPAAVPVSKPVEPDVKSFVSGLAGSIPPEDSEGGNVVRYDVTFQPGNIVAGRYKVLALLGRGGMGEVYKVEDLEFAEVVALKTILPETQKDLEVLRRFKREIQLARRVTHRNVCRIHDVAYHNESSSQAVAFVTMEYLAGETLAEYLGGKRRLFADEAISIATQLCEGLSAAHQLGIVHRDFKSSNIMLVRDGTLCRAVITDFGLARTVGAGDVALTTSGVMIGTPAYIAPEQIHHHDVGAAADIYSFGVVLFEMLTGRLPFVGESAMSVVTKRLTESPPSPRSIVPDLDSRLESAILKCLQKDPQDRFRSVGEIAEALQTIAALPASAREHEVTMMTPGPEAAGISTLDEPPPVGASTGVPEPALISERARRISLIGFAIAAVIAILGSMYFAPRVEHQAATASVSPKVLSIAARPAVAVLPLQNASRDTSTQWISTAMGELLAAQLSTDKVRLIPGETVSRARKDLALDNEDTFSPASLKRIRTSIGSDYVVAGSYVSIPGAKNRSISYSVKVLNAVSGETIGSFVEEIEPEQITQAAARIGSRLRSKLNLPELTATAEPASRAALPLNRDAMRLYAEGLARLRNSEFSAAQDFLQKALALEPQFALAHEAMSEAWAALGYDEKAGAEAKQAFDLSESLPRSTRLNIEARYRESQGAWQKAVEIYQLLLDFTPDDVDAGLRLAFAQTTIGHPRDAIATLKQLRRLPPPLREDIRIDLAQADADYAIGDHRSAIQAADRAIGSATMLGAKNTAARAIYKRALNEAATGKQPEALASLTSAQALYRQSGDRRGEAIVMGQVANVVQQQGNVADAEKMLKQALSLNTEIGDVRNQAHDLNDLANLYVSTGRLPEARVHFERSLSLIRSAGERRSEAETLFNYGGLLAAQGDMGAARNVFEQTIKTANDVGNRSLAANALGGLGHVLYDGFADPKGIGYFEDALKKARESGELGVVLRALNDLATARLDQGRLAEAISNYQESLSISRELGDKAGEATALSNMAAAQFEAGQPTTASPLFADAVKMWRGLGDKFLLSYSLADYSQLLAAQNDLAHGFQAAEESQRIRAELEDQVASAAANARIALIAIEQGDVARAESMAASAATTLEKANQFDDAILAWVAVARGATARGDSVAMRNASSAAAADARRSKSYLSHQISAVLQAEVAAESSPAKSVATLASIADDAKQRGYIRISLETRLAWARTAIAKGRKAEVNGALEQLISEANSRGFRLIASRARQLNLS